MTGLKKSIFQFGPAIFAIGYTIGTGSVTTMTVSGSRFGMELLWVLFVSCLFSWALMEAYGRYYLVTGESALFAFRKHIKWGAPIGILVIIGVSLGQWNALVGILGITSNALYETLAIFIPDLTQVEYQVTLAIAIVITICMYLILLTGRFSIFEKLLTIFVSLMGLSFIISNFIVLPDPVEVVKGMIPSIPDHSDGNQMVVAFVGTTMAAATFLSRPLFIQGKGWTKDDMKLQSQDAINASILIFVVCGSIMTVATSTLFHEGKTVERVLDMVETLNPIAGNFAIAVFLLGTLSAGLSSIFPILMIFPLLVADYQSGKLDITSKRFRILTAIICMIGLTVPLLGGNPIEIQILTQVFLVFVLPLVVLGIGILVNRKTLMEEHKAGWLLNLGLVLAFIFSMVISYQGIMVLVK
jgi:Mn2+/Fe2+ NRAMP family transporter